MIQWIPWLLILQFIRCSFTGYNSYELDGRKFHTIDSQSFDFQTLDQKYAIINILINYNRTMNCAKFIPNFVSTTSAGKLLFNGKLTMTRTLTMDYQPKNLTGDLKYANNLTETLRKGLNVDIEIYNYLTMVLKSGTARMDFTSNTNNVDLDGTFLSPSILAVSSTSVKSKLNTIFNVTSSNGLVNGTNISSFQVTEKSDKLLLVQSTSTSIIQVNNTELVSESNPNLIINKSPVSYTYEYCPDYVLKLIATTTSSSPPQTTTFAATIPDMNPYSSYNFSNSFSLLFIMIILTLAGFRKANLEENVDDIELRVFDEATLKMKAEEFFVKYPIGSVGSRELDKATALLPQTMVDHPIAISMIPPREIADFDCFGDVLPVVEIGEIDDQSGSQIVKFTGGVECNVQCNTSLVPRLLDTELQNDTLENDQLPPPAFNSIDNNDSPLECFYQVRIVTLEENSPNLAIGFVTGLYPPFRLPGLCDKSIAFHCQDSTVRFCGETVPFPEIEIYEGDTLGIGYYLQPTTNPDSTLKNVHFYFTFEKKRYEREFILENMDIGLIQPSIGSRSDCEVEVVFGPLYTAFAPESV
ncbi:hypothetical protein BC833DRAFT_569204 [Globomyces pollinis-pini]|nr:hypothetical protein BC833DRAFT_569204 [Globomyces pollinis-pini]